MIAEPRPGSRSTSRRIFSPLVIACSAWVRCVDGSPWALTIVCDRPAAVNAASRYLRSNCSHRTDDWVSGSSTAMTPLPAAGVVAAGALLEALLLLLLLLDDPQPATTRATSPRPISARTLVIFTWSSSCCLGLAGWHCIPSL